MKRNMILILPILFFTTTFCSEKEVKQQENSIYGTWELIQVYSNTGTGQGNWNPVESEYSYIYQINPDNTFESTKYNDCNNGYIEIDSVSHIISFTFTCNDFHPCTQGSQSCKEYFSFDKHNNLILSASYRNCDEGCPQFKFRRVE